MSRIIGCRGDAERSAIVNLTANGEQFELKDAAGRTSLIADVRAGKHVEVALTALTFRQKDGTPNKKHLRFATAALPKLATSYVGMPVLRDHDSHSQLSRVGTVKSSQLVMDGGFPALRQVLEIVKPEAVISVLDGTLDRFSIGWSATGPVMCTAHEVDVRARGACGCWPGDVVTLDGGKSVTVEYEFQSAEGTEVSAVNVPAVKGTKIESVRSSGASLAADRAVYRAALAAELHLEIPDPGVGAGLTLEPEFEASLAIIAEQSGLDIDELRANAIAGRAAQQAEDPEAFERALAEVALQLDLDLAELQVFGRAQRAEREASAQACDDDTLDAQLEDMANQLGLDPKDMLETKRRNRAR